MADENAPLHGTAIAHSGTGCLILGASGTGKSRLAAEAMSQGAKLVADDRVALMAMSGLLAASAAPGLQGILEIRGMGLIRLVDVPTRQIIHLIVELDPETNVRLPEPQTREYCGIKVPYLRLPPAPHTCAATLLLYLRSMQDGRVLPPDWRPNA